ncbi:kelch-like protein 2 [Paramacrobiotus metropolitanus]|uniref:kelch-like protein 2 n=1 Tax=Paramacrobiotus metropolitanus TaxID=2943436 RepID=UPI002445EFC1|nr:kelch-like protein 2 [Paramacrobiotus metropolitanus]
MEVDGFLRGLRELQATGTLCDVVLYGSDADEGSALANGIPCHRGVLSVHSAYFRAVFTHDWKDSRDPVFQLHNVDTATMNALVQYAYSMEIGLNADNVASLVVAAEFLQMDRVAGKCWAYVQQHFLRSIFLLVEVLASDDVAVFSEDQVLQALLRWLDHDRDRRLAQLHTVLQVVRVPFLSEPAAMEYALALASAPAPSECQSGMVGRITLAGGTARHATPRDSYGARDVILCIGGHFDGDLDEVGVSDTVEVFCPSMPSVWRLPALPGFVNGCQAVMLDASGMLVAGHSGVNRLQRDRHYLGLRDEWEALAVMRMPRCNAGLAVLQGRVYAAGGCSRADRLEVLASVEVYDAQKDSWSTAAPLPVALEGMGMVAWGERLFVFGGKDEEEGIVPWAFSYDPQANAWTRLPDMPTPRYGCAVCVAPSGLVFVFGT